MQANRSRRIWYNKGTYELNKSFTFTSTNEDSGIRIEGFAIIKLRGFSTKLMLIGLLSERFNFPFLRSYGPF